VVLSLPFSFF
jgi:hypothetical protein